MRTVTLSPFFYLTLLCLYHHMNLEWTITDDNQGAGPSIAKGCRDLGSEQTAFDAELAAIEQAISWFTGPERGWQQ
jgi:hypothetical protein